MKRFLTITLLAACAMWHTSLAQSPPSLLTMPSNGNVNIVRYDPVGGKFIAASPDIPPVIFSPLT